MLYIVYPCCSWPPYDDQAKMTTSAGWRWETLSGPLMDQEAALRTRPHLQTSEHWGLCGALRPQVRTPQVWPPVMSGSRTVNDRALSSFWWPPDQEMSSGVPLIGDPDASRKMEHTNTNINLTLSVFYFSLSFFLSLSTLWPRPQGINSRNCNMFISLDLPDEGFTINRKLAERCSSFTPNPFPKVISQPGRRHKERRSFAKGNCRYIYSHHFTCFCHSTELALFILDGPSAPLESNKLEERRPNRNRCVKFVTER